MAVRTVLKMGDARLLEKSRAVEAFATPGLQALIRDMLDTMAEYNGAGLAAPQINADLRVVVFGGHASARYPHAPDVPDTVLINPVIEVLDSELEYDWEGCLSLPGLRGLVPRYRRICYRGHDENGDDFACEADGFHARVVQHECDHLDGILYPMRMTDLSRFGFEEALNLHAGEAARV